MKKLHLDLWHIGPMDLCNYKHKLRKLILNYSRKQKMLKELRLSTVAFYACSSIVNRDLGDKNI
jgi:hypothetical protein